MTIEEIDARARELGFESLYVTSLDDDSIKRFLAASPEVQEELRELSRKREALSNG